MLLLCHMDLSTVRLNIRQISYIPHPIDIMLQRYIIYIRYIYDYNYNLIIFKIIKLTSANTLVAISVGQTIIS